MNGIGQPGFSSQKIPLPLGMEKPNNTCPQCGRELKPRILNKLSNTLPYSWSCACGLVATEKEKPRTPSQNKALHKLFTDVSNHCIAVGLDQKTVVNKLEAYSCPTSPAFIKETWRSMQIAITGKASTTELTSAEINQVYDVFTKFWSELTGEHFTFPSYDALAFETLGDNQ